MLVTGSTASATSNVPTGTVMGVLPQPALSVELQVAPLMTETVLSTAFATYTVSVV
jgi:hypothetical protein